MAEREDQIEVDQDDDEEEELAQFCVPDQDEIETG